MIYFDVSRSIHMALLLIRQFIINIYLNDIFFKIKKSHFMFSLYFMLFATFLYREFFLGGVGGWGRCGGGGGG